MTNTLLIAYKNGTIDEYKDGDIDNSTLTIQGHASKIVDVFSKGGVGVYALDKYTAVLLDEIISIRVRRA